MEENDWVKRREPLTFMLYLGMGGSILIFLTLFSFLIRSKSPSYIIPLEIWLSTAFILLSSVSLHASNVYFKIQRFEYMRTSLLITFIFALLFLFSQISAWFHLRTQNIHISGVIVLLTGLHLAHILGGILVLLFTVFKLFKKSSYIDSFIYAVNPPNQLNFKLLNIYWHFLGVLWVCILLFICFHAA